MKNRLYDYICIFVVLEILQLSIGYAKIISDTRRTKPEISVAKTSQLKEDTNYAKEINLQHEEKSDNELEEDGTYHDDTSKQRKILKKAANFMSSNDLHPSNAEESFNRDNVPSYLNSQRSNEDLEKTEEADEEATKRKRDKNEKVSNLIRLSRNINDDFNRYTDQDERSSLYDDYEAKDIAKRGVLSGSEDYEEMEDDLLGIEDMAAVQELTNEAEKRETQKDARVKRDQAEISEMLDKSRSNLDNPRKLEESKITEKNPYLREVSRTELSKNFNEASAPNTINNFEFKDVISKLSDSSKIQGPANTVALLKKDESNAEYEKRVEEEIQRKIDLIKEEIERDIEAQQRIRDIENNNARFDELQDQEHEDEERQNFENESIKKRQTIAKRSVQEIADDAITSSEKSEKKRSLKKEQNKKRQHQSNKIGISDISKQNGNLKRQVLTDKPSEQVPSKELFTKKRKRVRQIFLVNNDQLQTKRRQLRSYLLPSAQAVVRFKDELFMNPKLNSCFHMDNRMLEKSSPVGSEDEINEEEQSPTAEQSDSLVPLIGSSQELSPRLEKEYKEAFGGLQSEPGNALARFKRVKRVLTNGPNTI
ncbi:PREDICTED: golgin subfamily B member 1-like [Trachymyrmex cornetzi]|uniref:golgin subfamily B member 1-like n=1 Tax=Trachymyrmex cornetzi TaxID=471704 RepID=UPI00084EF492|nr:PREDICTED: golgin subfamily B member 1-like [Trachymyrmex cornetzi]